MEWLFVDVALWINSNLGLLVFLGWTVVCFFVGYAMATLHTNLENK